MHLAALRAHGDRLPVGVTVLVEGEEEIGSPALPQFLAVYQDWLGADVVVFADTANWTADTPALTTTLRGGTSVVVEVRTLRHGVHSGLYGGPVPDALTVLIGTGGLTDRLWPAPRSPSSASTRRRWRRPPTRSSRPRGPR